MQAEEPHPLLSSSHWGAYVIDADSEEEVYSHNASQLFIPASITKLFTTAVALEVLGPSHLFYTQVKASALPDEDGLLRGNLYLVGGGDPSLTSEGLRELARRVSEAGVRTVFGKILIDDSLFNGTSLPIHGEWEDLSEEYSAEENALSVNDNSVRVVVASNSEKIATIVIEQDVPYCQLVNKVTVDQKIQKPSLTICRGLTDNVITVTGAISTDATLIKRKIAVHHPQEFAKEIFIKALEERGVLIENSESSASQEQLYEIARLPSVPLLLIVNRINKESHNLSANLLFKATKTASFLSRASDSLLYDGAGLSRHNLITPIQTVALLAYMDKSCYNLQFLESLPSAGSVGTLAKRFSQEQFPGVVVRAKTGSMSGISNLAGFIELPCGRRRIFAIFINNSLWSGKETAKALDELLIQICK